MACLAQSTLPAALTSSAPSAAAALTEAAKAVSTALTAATAAASSCNDSMSSICAAHSSSHRLASLSGSAASIGSCCSSALVAGVAPAGVAAALEAGAAVPLAPGVAVILMDGVAATDGGGNMCCEDMRMWAAGVAVWFGCGVAAACDEDAGSLGFLAADCSEAAGAASLSG